MTSRVMRSSGINKPVGIAGSWRFCAVNVSVRSLRRKFYIYICMQATRRVKIVLVNGLTEGVWLLTTTDPYRTEVVVLVHVFGPVTHCDWSHHWHHRHHRPIRLSWSRAYLAIFVCAHAFSRLTATVGSHGSRCRLKSLNSNPNPNPYLLTL